MGQLNFFLEIEVCRTLTKLFLSQGKYIYKLLKRINMAKCKGIETPLTLVENCKDRLLYRSVVGALQYITVIRY